MDQKQSDILTLIHLIKTESKRTRDELTKHFDEKITSQITESESRIGKEMRKGFENQKQELTEYLDNKFEEHRRQVIDEIQIFEDHIVKENIRLNQESVVNSARLKKLENQVFSN